MAATKSTQNTAITHSTFVIERSYPVAPERVFAAFSDPAKKARWYAGERGMATEEFEMDFRVGGKDYARYRLGKDSPFAGAILENHTMYQDIVPDRRIVIAYTMSMGGNRFSASQATFELIATAEGTNLIFTEQGAYFENADGPKIREKGWSGLLERLGQELAQ